MSALLAAASYTLEPLSPLHVGTGERLGPHDVVTLDGALYRLDTGRLLEELEHAPQARDQYLTSGLQAVSRWLQQGGRLERLALYRCQVPRQPRSREDVRPFLADPLLRPYVPGTEVKGAVRTAMLWQLVGSSGSKADLAQKIGRRRNRRGEVEDVHDRKEAGRWLEQTVLGEEPREDALRVLRVTDTEPAPAASLRVYPVLVAALQRNGLAFVERPRSGDRPSSYTADLSRAVANFCECLQGVRLGIRVELDRFLLDRWKQRGPDASFVTSWAEACNAFSRWIVRAERDWWNGAAQGVVPALRPVVDSMLRFYDDLTRRLERLPGGHVVLNLGWGGGWRTKTVAEQFGPQVVGDLVRRYNLDRRSGSRPFPKTRKVAWLEGNRFAPLGWVMLVPR